MSDSYKFGIESEERAVQFFLSLGYTIITRRFRVPRGELDLVALDGDLLVFAEVKARHGTSRPPEEALSQRKLQAMSRAANGYLAYIEEPDRAFRFDWVAIDDDGLRHYQDVFST